MLKLLGITAKIKPAFFGSVELFPLSWKQSAKPNVYLTVHAGREREYGLETLEAIAKDFPDITFHVYGRKTPFHEVWRDHVGNIYNLAYQNTNIIYHGQVAEQQFNEEIKNYQCCLRMNEFEGMGDALAKSILMGQWPISRIKFQKVDHFSTPEELEELLRKLPDKKFPNKKAQAYWLPRLKRLI